MSRVVTLPAMAVRSLAGLIPIGLLLFLPAGTLAWPQAWVFLTLFTGCGMAVGWWLKNSNPDLLAERMKSPFSANQRPWDRAIVTAIHVWFAAWLVLMGLDDRYRWSSTPAWVQGLGAALIVAAFWGWVPVLRANSFASATVRVQAERGQTVASTGPYAVVRHPMYSYALVFLAGVPLLLGSLWGLGGLLISVPLLVLRTLGEEAVLIEGLPGYKSYAAKVRFRLVPGVW